MVFALIDSLSCWSTVCDIVLARLIVLVGMPFKHQFFMYPKLLRYAVLAKVKYKPFSLVNLKGTVIFAVILKVRKEMYWPLQLPFSLWHVVHLTKHFLMFKIPSLWRRSKIFNSYSFNREHADICYLPNYQWVISKLRVNMWLAQLFNKLFCNKIFSAVTAV